MKWASPPPVQQIHHIIICGPRAPVYHRVLSLSWPLECNCPLDISSQSRNCKFICKMFICHNVFTPRRAAAWPPSRTRSSSAASAWRSSNQGSVSRSRDLARPIRWQYHVPEVLLDCLLGPGLAPRQLRYQLLLADVLVIASETVQASTSIKSCM